MKTKLLLMGIAFFSLVRLNAQVNILQGSGMETADKAKWDTCSLQNAAGNTFEFAFGYTDAVPSGGSGGALHILQTNSGSNGAGLMFYQQVKLNKAHRYYANMKVKTLQPMDNSWFEVYCGDTKPVVGKDYTTTVPGKAQFMGGFKWTTWETNCATLTDNFDADFFTERCSKGGLDTLTFTGKGDTTMYFGFRSGIWAHANSIEFVIDNVQLIDIDSTSTGIQSPKTLSVVLTPNPALSTLTIQSSTNFNKAIVFNVLGQHVIEATNFNNSINVSSLKTGVYIIELKDAKNNTVVSKFYKK